MDPEPLFLRRCEQIAELMQSRDEIDLLDVAGLLRQVIMDKHSLLDTANKNRIKPKFHVGVSRYADNDPYEKSTFWMILDGIDPEIRAPGAPSAHLTANQFLQHVVINDHGNRITIKDIIDNCANVSGGRHHDPRPKNTPITLVNRKVTVRGFPVDVSYIRGIATVALRAMQPVIDDVHVSLRVLPVYGRATYSAVESFSDDRFREAIHLDARQVWIASFASLLAMTAMQKLPDGQITSDFQKSCQAPFAKIFRFAFYPNHF